MAYEFGFMIKVLCSLGFIDIYMLSSVVCLFLLLNFAVVLMLVLFVCVCMCVCVFCCKYLIVCWLFIHVFAK